jgi:hypothetical protein
MSSENLSTRDARDACDTRAKRRLDYHQLNDGSDNEADIADRMERTSIVSIK